MDLNKLKEKFKKYSKKEIIFTTHAEIRAIERGIELDEVRENIINPKISLCKKTKIPKGRRRKI